MDVKCECRKKIRDEKERRLLRNRIRRIAGQLGGIERMIEDDAYCPDILIQISAASSALSALSRALLTEHIKTCVLEDIRSGKESGAEELAALIERLGIGNGK